MAFGYLTFQGVGFVSFTERHCNSAFSTLFQVCSETPEYTRRHRGDKHETRKAVLSVRNDGYVNYASPAVSADRPDADTIMRSRLADCCLHTDMLAVHPDGLPTVRRMGVS